MHSKIVGDLDLSAACGLEIGPLHNPCVSKSEANVFYLDHATEESLRQKYENNGNAAAIVERIVDVDYVQKPGQALLQAVGGRQFDYIVASHVIEHIPDMVGWFHQVTEVLVPGGVLCLAIPDKRFSFDVNRQLTTMADLIDAHLRAVNVPTFRQIYDHEVHYVPVDAAALWNGEDYRWQQRTDVGNPQRFAYSRCIDQRDDPDTYRDVHCSTFTPESFLDILANLATLGLIGLELQAFFPTEPNDCQFFVRLKRPDRGADAASTPASLAASIAATRARIAALAQADHEPATLIAVSNRELRTIELKRRAVTAARRQLRRLGRSW